MAKRDLAGGFSATAPLSGFEYFLKTTFNLLSAAVEWRLANIFAQSLLKRDIYIIKSRTKKARNFNLKKMIFLLLTSTDAQRNQCVISAYHPIKASYSWCIWLYKLLRLQSWKDCDSQQSHSSSFQALLRSTPCSPSANKYKLLVFPKARKKIFSF